MLWQLSNVRKARHNLAPEISNMKSANSNSHFAESDNMTQAYLALLSSAVEVTFVESIISTT